MTLTTDAFEKTIGAVLTQKDLSVINISRNLTSAEQNYSNIERKTLPVVFAVTRIRQFLLGWKFTLRIDHKPLQYIYNPSNEIPKVVSARLERWAITLMTFNCDVQNNPCQGIGQADAMSRLRFKDCEDDLVAVAMGTFEKPLFDAKKLRNKMQSNKFTKRLLNRIRTGNWKICTKLEKFFLNLSNTLTAQNDSIYNESRCFIPITSQKQVIEKFRDVHQEINAWENSVKNNTSWPFMNDYVEQLVTNCAECSENRPRLTDSTDKCDECAPW